MILSGAVLRLVFLAGLVIGLTSSCARPIPRPNAPDASRCRRLDEQAGVAPVERRRCWQAIAAAQVDPPAQPGARQHATLRAHALSGETQEATIADAPARWDVTPVAPGALPAPPPSPPTAPDEACRVRARACDDSCAGSAAWSTCLARCDTALAICLGDPE